MQKSVRDQILKNIGIRLSVLAEQSGGANDEILARLRQALRGDADENELREISDQLLVGAIGAPTDLARISGEDTEDLDINSFFKRLSNSLLELELDDRELSQSLRELAKDLTAEKSLGLRLVVLKETFHSILELQKKMTAQNESKKSWLRLPGMGKKKQETRWFGEFFSDVILLVDRVLEQMLSLNDNHEKVLEIRQQLHQVDEVESIESVVGSVLELLGDITQQIRSERVATQAFLGEMAGKLRNIEDVMVHCGESNGSFYERAMNFSEDLSRNMDEIGEDLKTSQDISVLRQSLEARFKTVADSMTSYVESEREHSESYRQQVDQLSEKLKQMEQEAHGLRASLKEKHQLAVKDSLTGVYNRAGIEERMSEEVSRCQRSGADLSLIFVDCNKFKPINDTYGHRAGDLVLRKVAEIFKKRARLSDVIGRWGGDEFIILLPDTPLEGAGVFAKSVAQMVMNTGFHASGKPIEVSISCGVTQFKPDDDAHTVLERADQAMNRAKKQRDHNICIVR